MHSFDAAPESFNPLRSLGMAVAIAVHIGAGLMLFAAADGSAETSELRVEKLEVIWIAVPKPKPVLEIPPIPPAPPRLQKTPPRPQPPAPTVQVVVAAPQLAIPIAAAPTAEPATTYTPAQTPAPSGPVEVSSLEYAQRPGSPRYPKPALLAGHEGTVLLRIHVDVDGRPTRVEVASSSGHRLLDRAAVEFAMRQLRFKPAQRDGRPVPAIAQVPVAFALPDRA